MTSRIHNAIAWVALGAFALLATGGQSLHHALCHATFEHRHAVSHGVELTADISGTGGQDRCEHHCYGEHAHDPGHHPTTPVPEHSHQDCSICFLLAHGFVPWHALSPTVVGKPPATTDRLPDVVLCLWQPRSGDYPARGPPSLDV